MAKRLETSYPATNRGRGIKLWPLWQTPFNNAGTLLPTLEIMLAVVAFCSAHRMRQRRQFAAGSSSFVAAA